MTPMKAVVIFRWLGSIAAKRPTPGETSFLDRIEAQYQSAQRVREKKALTKFGIAPLLSIEPRHRCLANEQFWCHVRRRKLYAILHTLFLTPKRIACFPFIILLKPSSLSDDNSANRLLPTTARRNCSESMKKVQAGFACY
jgi:hypothetical protein